MMHSTKSNPTHVHKYRFEAIGTEWEVVTTQAIGEATKQKLYELVDQFDKTYSRFRADSLVRLIATTPGVYEFPPSAAEIFLFYDELYELTDGRVSPLVGAVLEDLGYDAGYSLTEGPVRPLLDYKKEIRRAGATITTARPVLFDIGAVGKGYLVDQLCNLLDLDGFADYIVDGSGDLRHKGTMQNRVGLEHPFDTSKIIGSVEVENRALCASATNRRAWGDGLHHIVDAKSGKPTEKVIASWVIADTAMLADGLATALFFSSPERLAARYTYEYVRINADKTVEYTEFFKGRLY